MQDQLVRQHRILGIDPGTLLMGYAILNTEGQHTETVVYDVFDVRKTDDQYARLQKEFFFLQDIIDKYKPTCLAIETQFVDKNPQTMIKIVHAQGVAIAAALSRDVPVYEYSPMKIKMAITGNGHSTKQQVADMLIRFLGLDAQVDGNRLSNGKPLDATDALAIAYCHFLQLGLPLSGGHGAKNWTQYAKQRGLAGSPVSVPNQKLMAALAGRK
ncbi:MAG: crossover junction endodeoxyribonuclease RuvC [Paludibacteraceae bacterium]|nr:crossover junction endodeoxyribonuclease RuvC [Paludibacteraceae bacterium]